MASNLGDKIIKIVANSQGVKTGVDQAAAELRRLERAATEASKSLDKALGAGGRSSFTGTTGVPGLRDGQSRLALGRRGDYSQAAEFDRRHVENFNAQARQAAENLRALNTNFGIFQRVIKDATDKFLGSEINRVESAKAVRDANLKLARAIQAEADDRKFQIARRNLVLGARDGGAGVGGFRLGDTGRDQSESDFTIGQIRDALSGRRPVAAPSLSARRALGEQQETEKLVRDAFDRAQVASQIAESNRRRQEGERAAREAEADAAAAREQVAERVRLGRAGGEQDEADKVRRDAAARAQVASQIAESNRRRQEGERAARVAEADAAAARQFAAEKFRLGRAGGEREEADKVQRDAAARELVAKQIAETLKKQKALEDEANRILAARNRVISGLASQRAAALADPDNLAALNRFERNRGLPVTAGQPFGARVRGGIANLGQSTRLGRFATGAADRGLSLVGLGGSENAPALASQLFGGAATLASKAVGIVGGALKSVGGFVVTEFVNFVSRVAANLTSRLIAAVTEGIVFLSGKAIDAAKRYEDAVVSFGVLGGSPGRGAKLVDELQRLAIDTPFKFQEVLDESKLLLSYGVSVNDLTKRLRQLGDVASGTGVDLSRLSLAFGQVLAKGRLQGPEIRQFTEAGVGIRDFVSAFNELEGRNVSTQGFLSLVEQGDVSAKVVERAFDRMTGAGGRFFNFMEVRSKTVSGRLNALFESFELVIQKVGKSVFDKFNIAGAIDVLVGKLSGINFKDIDNRIGRFAQAAVPFGRGVAGGLGGVFEGFKTFLDTLFPNQEGVKKNFAFLGEVVIPKLLKFGQLMASLFLKLSAVMASVADTLIDLIEPLAQAISVAVGLLNRLAGGGIEAPKDRPLLAARNLALDFDAAIAKVDFGKLFKDNFKNNNITIEEAKGIVAADIINRNLGGGPQVAANDDARLKKAKEIVKAEEDRLAAIEATNNKIADNINNIIANAGLVGRLEDNPFKSFPVAGFEKPLRLRGSDVKAFNDIIRGDTRGFVEQATGGAGLFKMIESISGQAIPKNLEEFNNALKEAAGKGIPNFNQRIEEIGKLGEKTKDPVDEFKKNLETIARLDTDDARRAGFGLEADAARRARGRLAADFIERFKAEEIKPAQLVRAGSQEAEQALTRAIYEARNNSKTPEEELTDALEKAGQATKTLNENTEKLAVATEKLVDKRQDGFGFFLGLGFGP